MIEKRTVELSIDSDLAAEAEAAGTDLSALLERALRQTRSRERAPQWLAHNADAIVASRAELDANGMWYQPDWLDR
jgi:antitoxin CcdA